MERPKAFTALNLETTPPADTESVRCDLAKGAYNAATRGKLAYFWLSFSLAIALAIAAGYALIAFDDDKDAAGYLALIAAVGALITTGVFFTLWRRASADADRMWKRVEKYCR